MWKTLLSYGMDFIGGSSVQIYIYLALAIGGFGAGLYVGNLRLVNYKEEVKVITQKQEEQDRKSTRLNSSHMSESRMPSSA